MNSDIALLLTQDGLVNGAIYLLVALAFLLAFQVSRVIFIPLGSFVAFGALTLATMQTGRFPAVAWLLGGGGILIAVIEIVGNRAATARERIIVASWNIGYPLAIIALLGMIDCSALPVLAQAILCFLLLVPLGPMIYRLVYQPMLGASVLVLFIVSIAVDVALVSLALLLFGADGVRSSPMFEGDVVLGTLTISGQSIVVLLTSAILIATLYLFFEHTVEGKALRATAINRVGARLVGISPAKSGKRAFALSVFIALCAGILNGPTTTIYYDSGFLIGLHGLVGAILGGFVSFPLAASGALLVGVIEAFSAFEASAFKEVIVFSLLLPILLARTLLTRPMDDEAQE